MRSVGALVLISALAAGCTPYIPVRDDFGTSALMAVGETPRAFGAFNNYDPAIGQLVAQQICATPYVPLEQDSRGAVPGQLIEATGRCQTHVPLFGNGP
jgi:hypothetical protein